MLALNQDVDRRAAVTKSRHVYHGARQLRGFIQRADDR